MIGFVSDSDGAEFGRNLLGFFVQSILDRKRILAVRKTKDCFRVRPWQILFQPPMPKRVDDSDDSSIEEIRSNPQVSFKNPAPCQLYLALQPQQGISH